MGIFKLEFNRKTMRLTMMGTLCHIKHIIEYIYMQRSYTHTHDAVLLDNKQGLTLFNFIKCF